MAREGKAKSGTIADGGAIVVLDVLAEDSAFAQWRIEHPNTKVRLVIFAPSMPEATDAPKAADKA